MKAKLFTLTVLAAIHAAAYAQPTGATSPLQQIPPPRAPPGLAPQIRVEPGTAPRVQVAEGAEIMVSSLRVIGQTLYSERELLEVTGFRPQSLLTVGALRTMASKIAAFYNERGYIVAQAYVPAQEVTGGSVSIVVNEGQYGGVISRNTSSLSDSVVNNILRNLKPGGLVANAPLERSLLLLSDIPGIEVGSTMAPGSQPGTSDLVVDIKPGQAVTGDVEVDNEGNRYTGENRVIVTVNLNNPTGRGDIATLRGLTSGGGLNYLRGSYQMPIGDATAGVALTGLQYRLGREFESLGATGTVGIASVYGSYPLIRSRSRNLYATLAFDAKTFQDKVESTATVTDKKSRSLTAGLNGNFADTVGAGGLTQYALAWTTGVLDIQTPAALVQDNSTLKSDGHFRRLAFNLQREQNMGGPFSLFAGVKGQLASKNLDASERMELGGAYGVRAYPEGEANADQGFVLNVEARYLLNPVQGWPGQMQLVGFIDTGSVTLNKNPWAAGTNRRTLSAIGMGFNWWASRSFLLKASYAHKLGHEAATSAPDSDARIWLRAIKYF